MNRLIVFTSKKNKYDGHLLKFKNEFKNEVIILNIEDYNIDFNKNDIIYFCTNSSMIVDVINYLKKYNCRIINKEYLMNNNSKYNNQELLSQIYNTPKIYSNLRINFPLYLKENKHEGIVLKCINRSDYDTFLKNNNLDNFYIEEAIHGVEEKLYYVWDKTFKTGDTPVLEVENDVCELIKKSMKVEVFSIDVIKKDNGKLYVIDFNSAPGFYMLDEARKYFLNGICKMKSE